MFFILHVEDDPIWIDLVRDFFEDEIKPNLENQSYILSSASTAESATTKYGEIVKTGKIPDILILDVNLDASAEHETGGIEVAKMLAKFGFADVTSVIILTQNENAQTIIKIFNELGNDQVAKIFHKSQFYQAERSEDFKQMILTALLGKSNFKLGPSYSQELPAKI